MNRLPTTPPDASGFAFVYNVSTLVGADSFMLTPGHELRRAAPAEIAIIKKTLMASNEGLLGLQSFQWELQKEEDGSFAPLPDEKWKYFVIGFHGNNDNIVELEHAFSIAQKEIRIAFTSVSFPGGSMKGMEGTV